MNKIDNLMLRRIYWVQLSKTLSQLWRKNCTGGLWPLLYGTSNYGLVEELYRLVSTSVQYCR